MGDRALGPLSEILGLNLRLAHGAVQRHFSENFVELELTQKQISVLWLVEDGPGIDKIDIARRLEMDRATTMAIVHALERRGLIRRARSSDDARRIALELTDAGHAILAKAKAAIAVHEDWLKGRFTAREAQLLRDLLGRIRR